MRLNSAREMMTKIDEQLVILDSFQVKEYFNEAKEDFSSIKFGEFEMAGNDQKEQKLYHSELLSIKESYIRNQNLINNEKTPTVSTLLLKKSLKGKGVGTLPKLLLPHPGSTGRDQL